MKYILLPILLSFFLVSCNDDSQKGYPQGRINYHNNAVMFVDNDATPAKIYIIQVKIPQDVPFQNIVKEKADKYKIGLDFRLGGVINQKYDNSDLGLYLSAFSSNEVDENSNVKLSAIDIDRCDKEYIYKPKVISASFDKYPQLKSSGLYSVYKDANGDSYLYILQARISEDYPLATLDEQIVKDYGLTFYKHISYNEIQKAYTLNTKGERVSDKLLTDVIIYKSKKSLNTLRYLEQKTVVKFANPSETSE